MNYKSGAVPKKPQLRRRNRLPSSDSEDDLGRNFIATNRLKHMSESMPSCTVLQSDILYKDNSVQTNEIRTVTNSVEINEWENEVIPELHKLMKKYEKEDKDSIIKSSKSAAEVGKAAILAAQSKLKNNNVIDLTRKASNVSKKVKLEIENRAASNVSKKIKPEINNGVTVASKTGAVTKSKSSPAFTTYVKTSTIASKNPHIPDRKILLNKRENTITAAKKANITVPVKSLPNKRPIISTFNLNTRGVITTRPNLNTVTNTSQPQKTANIKNIIIKFNTGKPIEVIDEKTIPSLAPSPKEPGRNSLNSFVPECPVCFEQLLRSKPTVATSCGHLYCRECIDAIRARNNKCPICRIELKQIIDLHL